MSANSRSYALDRATVDKLLETALFFRRVVMADVWLLDEGGEPWRAPGPLCALQDWERLDSALADLRLAVTEVRHSELRPQPSARLYCGWCQQIFTEAEMPDHVMAEHSRPVNAHMGK